MQRFLGRQASSPAEATSNGSPEPSPHPPLSRPTFSLSVFGLNIQNWGEAAHAGEQLPHPSTWSAPLNLIHLKTEPGGTTHIRLTSLPSRLGKKKKSGNARGWAEPHLGKGADLLLGLALLGRLSSVAPRTSHHGASVSSRGHLFAGLQFPASHHLFWWTYWAWKGSDCLLILIVTHSGP